MQPNPVVTMDPNSWNDEWESEDNENSPVAIEHNTQNNELQQEHSPLPVPVNNERSRSGWFQDVIEGVRLTAVQSGQEIFQASSVLTSGIIQRAIPKSNIPDLQPIDVNSLQNDIASSPTNNAIFIPLGTASSDAKISPSHPTATIDPESWSDEWESEEDAAENPSNIASHQNSGILESGFSEQIQPHRSGWLQNVLEGVRITAVQSGHEIMHASSVLTSEVIQKTLSKSHTTSEDGRFCVGDAQIGAPMGSPALSPNLTPVNDYPNRSSETLNSAGDPTAWNDEWEVDEDDQNDAPISRNYSRDAPGAVAEDHQGGAGWLQDVFNGVRISAVQSGQEILQASGALTSGVIQKAKIFVPFHDAPESNDVDQDGSNVASFSPSPSSPSHTLNEMFSSAVIVSASDRDHPDDHSSDQSISSRSSDAELSEFLWTFPDLETTEDTHCGSFDALFSFHGGTECEDQLEKLGRESIIHLQRMAHVLNSGDSRIDDISNEVFNEGSLAANKSTLISNMKRLGGDTRDSHRALLERDAQLKDDRDIFLILDQVHVSTTRALAVLAARSVNLLLHSIQQWVVGSKRPMKFARVLRTCLLTFYSEANSIAELSIHFVRQALSTSNAHDDDVSILCADIEVDLFQAQIKLEDAVSNVVPILQCMELPQ